MLSVYCTTAQAALQAVGPISAATTLPTWYQDTTGLALVPCLDANGLCVLPPTPAPPFTTTGPISDLNFPNEIFYFLADSSLPVTGGATAKLRLAFEASFLAGVSPNAGITFLRINLASIKSPLSPNSTYTVTHPYGSFTFVTDAAGGSKAAGNAAFRTEDLSAGPVDGYFPPGLKAATNTHIGPFLKSAAGLITDPVTGTQYLGNPAVTTTVTGSPTGNNFFRISGPNIGGPGINTVQTNLFTLSGKLAPPPGTPITITSATYSQSATAGQVSVFATSTPTANLTVSGAGFPTTTMLHDPLNQGNFFATIAATTPASLPGVPAEVSVVNTQDAVLVPVPPPHTHPLVDGVTVSVANYDPFTQVLTVKASSSDTLAPVPTLSIPALLPPANVLGATGLLKVTLAVPPAAVTVASSGGGSATAPVTVGVLAPPVAAADTATTTAGTAVTIPVLANDTPAANITPAAASVNIVGVPVGGTAVVNAAGTVTFTPAVGFTGAASFSYTVTDNLALVSLPATVSITVTSATIIPVAVNDTATTVAGTPLTISVLANDTINPPGIINPASVAIVVGSAIGGTPVVNAAAGTVTFTPAAGFTGAASFSYTVQNTAVPPQTSNAAVVTISVTATPPPAAATAVNDVANTLVNVPRIINVVANDIGAVPSSVVIATPPTLGAVTNNLDGTVTYASGTAGTGTFTYNVKSSTGAVSNNATVTVSVTSAITDAVTVLRAQFKTSTKEWLLEGNTTNVSPASKPVTIYVGNSLAGQVLGTVVTNAADGRWKFQLPGNAGNIVPDVSKTVSVALPSGASRLAFPIAVSP